MFVILLTISALILLACWKDTCCMLSSWILFTADNENVVNRFGRGNKPTITGYHHLGILCPPDHHKKENDGCICPCSIPSHRPSVWWDPSKLKVILDGNYTFPSDWSPDPLEKCVYKPITPRRLWIISETVSKHIANILVVSSWWMCCKYGPFCRPPSLNELNHFRAGNWSLQGPDTKPQEELCGVVASIWALSRYRVLISRSVLLGHCRRIMGES